MYNFLKSFFRLFNAKIEKYQVIDKMIFGTVGWIEEDDKQDFVLNCNFENIPFAKAELLCDYLNKENLLNGDSIIISERELMAKLLTGGWNENVFKSTIDFLCSFEVKMLDDNEETDSFFIHF